MKFYFNPKADTSCGFFQFGLSGNVKFRDSEDEHGYVPWRLGGWYWPMGFFVKIGFINFTWYTKRLLKTRQQEIWIKDKWPLSTHQ